MQLMYQTVAAAMKKPRLSVPNFSALSAFLKGSDAICVLPGLMEKVSLRGFAAAPLPFTEGGLTMYMTWHRRDHLDPAHQWLRNRIKSFVDELV